MKNFQNGISYLRNIGTMNVVALTESLFVMRRYWALLVSYEQVLGFMDVLLVGFVSGGIIGLGILLYIFSRIFDKKSGLYKLTHEEWRFLDTYSVLRDLSDYFEEGLDFYRNRAVKRFSKLVEKIEEKWTIGRFKLAKEVLGKHIYPFKRSLRDKILLAIEEGDEENLRKAYDFLKAFIKYLSNPKPTLKELEQLSNMASTITTIPSEKLTFKGKSLAWMRTHTILIHILALTGCFAGGVFAFLFGVYFLHISVDYAYTAAFAFVGTLLIAYITYAKKPK